MRQAKLTRPWPADSFTHLYIIVFAYGTVSLVVVLLILRQTFDRTVLATRAGSSARLSARSVASSATRSLGGSTYCTDKLPFAPPFAPTAPGVDQSHSPFYPRSPHLERGQAPGIGGDYELGTPGGLAEAPSRWETTDVLPRLDGGGEREDHGGRRYGSYVAPARWVGSARVGERSDADVRGQDGGWDVERRSPVGRG